MPSIYNCYFLGDSWSEWEKSTVLDELPEEFATDGVAILLTSREGEERCYLYDPEKGLLSCNQWVGEEWGIWSTPIVMMPPANYSPEHEDTYFSIVSHEDGDWMVSINLSEGSVYCSLIESGTDGVGWESPSTIDPSPNLEESTDVFAANDDDAEWIVAVNLEDQSVCYAEWDGEEYSIWTDVPMLNLPDIWLEQGIDLDGAIVGGQLQVYAIVYDDDFEE